jgi:DDE superfamily endonuclease
MWIYHINSVHIVYLPPHTSHVLQPLDLSVFSQIKASYRAEIESLARFDDSAPIKKIRFVEYYNRARKEALSEHIIKAGWRGAGLFPWCPEKVLKSRQIIKNPTPVTPPRRPQNSSPTLLRTPENHHQLVELQKSYFQSENLPRGVWPLFHKTAKAFSRLHFEKMQNQQQISAQTVLLEEHTAKKQKRAIVNMNEQFLNIEMIRIAKLAQQAEQEAATAKSAAEGVKAPRGRQGA